MSWGYGRHNGPHTWSTIAEAAKGKKQSPIDINKKDAEFCPPLSFNPLNINFSSSKPKNLINTGSSVQMTFTDGGKSLSGGLLDGDYAIAQFHFHWGKSSDHGSEHTIDGEKYAGECHIVHYNKSKYATISEAVTESDGLCVLGMLIKVGNEHKDLKQLITRLEYIAHKNDIFIWNGSFNPGCLLPNNINKYWTYPGSLTTPPCYESVTWIVFEEPIEFSEEQLVKLRSLNSYPKSGSPSNGELPGHISTNFRPTQPLNDRIIMSSFKN